MSKLSNCVAERQSSSKLCKHKKKLILLVLLLVIVAVFLDSNLRLVKSELTVTLNGLPEAFDGKVIVHLSDSHMQRLRCERLIAMVRSANPDMIVHTGDLADTSVSIDEEALYGDIGGFFQKLADIAPTYFISGNHDIAVRRFMERVTPILHAGGVTVLRNDYVVLERDGQGVILAGIDDQLNWHHPNVLIDLRARIDESHDDPYIMLLAHRYNRLGKYAANGMDFVMAGHSHGGVVRLPLIGAIFSTRGGLFPRNAAGISRHGDTTMVTSRGIGAWRPPRFWNNPEVVVITLESR